MNAEIPPTRIEDRPRLSDPGQVVETIERVSQRRVPRRERFWEFRYRSTRVRRLDLPDLLDANRAPVIEYLRRRGIGFREAENAA